MVALIVLVAAYMPHPCAPLSTLPQELVSLLRSCRFTLDTVVDGDDENEVDEPSQQRLLPARIYQYEISGQIGCKAAPFRRIFPFRQ